MSIDYQRMAKVRPGQKAALTRAIKSGDPQRILAVCRAAVAEWNAIGAWPDDWHRWNIALSDARWRDPSLPASLDEV